jgi:UDP-glucose 4-epimerase
VAEDDVPQPRSAYALSRLMTEHVLAMGESDVVVIRLTNGVGSPVATAMSQWSLVANDLSRQAVVDGGLTLNSDGRQYRDFVALEDVCRVLTTALDPNRVPAGTYNFASARALTIRELAEMVQGAAERLVGDRPPLQTLTPKGDAVPRYVVHADALEALGLRAEVPLQQAVDETVRFCLDHRDELARETNQ